MDCFSKCCWLVPLTSKTSAVVSKALQHIFTQYGCPEKLQSDNGGEFVSHVVEELCSSLKIRIIHGGHIIPQKIRRILHYRLLDFSPEEQSTVWPFLLPEIAFILNNSWHSELCATPFEVFFGRSSRHYMQHCRQR